MSRRRLGMLLTFCALSSSLFAARPKPCISLDEAAKLANKDVCIQAHVYDVVELTNGTRFLDVCPPDTSDDNCRFTIVSLREDREQVGELRKYRDADVHVRGLVQPMRGRTGMVLSHARQFRGGPPKFRPKSQAASWIHRRARQTRHRRSQPSTSRRTPSFYEYQRDGAVDAIKTPEILWCRLPPTISPVVRSARRNSGLRFLAGNT